MAIRRINHTGRRRLKLRDIQITLSANGKLEPTFDAILNLSEYALPADACVFVEAYRQTSWMRFPFGTVGDICLPDDRRLSEFNSEEALLFRVKVTSHSDRCGVILAEADQIKPLRLDEQSNNRIPLLPVKPTDDLDVVWQINFDDNSRPILEINKSVGDWCALVRDLRFASLVYPSVLREILTRVLIEEKYDTCEDSTDWRSRWLQFACALPGVGSIPVGEYLDEHHDWIEQAVRAFARRHFLGANFQKHWLGEDWQ